MSGSGETSSPGVEPREPVPLMWNKGNQFPWREIDVPQEYAANFCLAFLVVALMSLECRFKVALMSLQYRLNVALMSFQYSSNVALISLQMSR